MKEIGEFLKTTRITNGVSLDEAAEDLNFSVSQLENIEDGNIRAFKDVFALRELVKEYGKYLGVKTDDIIDEFNDFMFEHTSKISLDDILEARKIAQDKSVEEKNKISSPYTNIRDSKFSIDKLKPILIGVGGLFLILVIIFILFNLTDKKESISTELKGLNLEGLYEFTY